MVGSASRELHGYVVAILQLVEVLATSSYQCTVMRCRNVDTKHDAVSQLGNDLFQLLLKLLDQSRFTT
jgi:hypothetical protein